MSRKTPHMEWKHLAARLILAGASVGGLSALAGCDQSEDAQFACNVILGTSVLTQPAAMEPSKDFAGSRLASNHNETFLVG